MADALFAWSPVEYSEVPLSEYESSKKNQPKRSPPPSMLRVVLTVAPGGGPLVIDKLIYASGSPSSKQGRCTFQNRLKKLIANLMAWLFTHHHSLCERATSRVLKLPMNP